MNQSTKGNRKNKPKKPAKPYADFPLFPHATRRWAKKIRSKFYYFGPWDDPDGALQKFLEQRDDLYAGRTPRAGTDGLTIRDLLNSFLTFKQQLCEAGELTSRTFSGYKLTCELIAEQFDLNRVVSDLRPEDFERLRATFSDRYGPVARGNEINKTRIIFKYAYDAELIDRPVRFGPKFKRPSRKTLRVHRAKNGPLMFESGELTRMIAAAGVQLRAMILLGINCGFGNADVGTLPFSYLDLKARWHRYPRPKTGIERRAPLWPETVVALEEAIAQRPTPVDDENAQFVFLTIRGVSWHRDTPDNPLSNETAKLLQMLDIKRHRLNFYALRHTFETIAGESRDQVAVDHIMGHARDDMASLYRERISDERLISVSDFVRNWLFETGDAQSEGEA